MAKRSGHRFSSELVDVMSLGSIAIATSDSKLFAVAVFADSKSAVIEYATKPKLNRRRR